MEFEFTQSFPPLLSDLSLPFTARAANRLLLLSAAGGGLRLTGRPFDRPSGLAVDGNRFALCTRAAIWRFEAVAAARWAPRHGHVTGDVDGHELAWAGDELTLVNTRFSCLSTLADQWSFVPGWRPRFVSEWRPDDRCRLTGMALDGERRVRWVTALGESDAAEGAGGVLVDVPSGEAVVRGLSRPHSPRLHEGRLLLLESGSGDLVAISDRSKEVVAHFDAVPCGMALHGGHAFVGLGTAIVAVDLARGATVGFVRFRQDVHDIFDIQPLPGVREPTITGLEDVTACVLPPGCYSGPLD